MDRRNAGTGTSSARFRADTYGLPTLLLANITGVHVDTARRWKRQGFVPGGHGQLVELRTTGDLRTLSRAWSGWTLRGDKLHTPDGWSITPGELQALPLQYSRVRNFERLFADISEDITL